MPTVGPQSFTGGASVGPTSMPREGAASGTERVVEEAWWLGVLGLLSFVFVGMG